MSNGNEKSSTKKRGSDRTNFEESAKQLSKKSEFQNLSNIWYISLIILSSICLLGLLSIYFLVLVAPSDVKFIIKKAGLTVTIIGGSGLFFVVLKLYLNAYTKIVKLLLTIMASFAMLFSTTSIVNLSNYNKAGKEFPLKAEMFKGYEELMGGDLDSAEETFRTLSQSKGQGEILGKEGLVSVYAVKGQANKALKLAEEVEKMAPDRGHVNTVKADILYIKGQKNKAKAEIQKAVRKKAAALNKKAVALNKLGRLEASVGNLAQAREFFDEAIAIDPYYIVAMANSGQTYEKKGKWAKALDAYRQALALNKDDIFAAALAKNDIARKKRLDSLTKLLAAKYRSLQESTPKEEDSWTSRPMVLSFMDFQESGGLSERNGFSSVLTNELSDRLNASGRVQVVDGFLIGRLLEELNIESSDITNSAAGSKLGKMLDVKIIGIGSIYHLQSGMVMSLKLIDTETFELPKVINRQFDSSVSLDTELNHLNREILTALIQKYPLRGFVVKASKDRIMINLGSKQGVSENTKFKVLKERKPIEYKGKILHSAPKTIAQLQVVQIEPDLCYTRILNQQSSIASDYKVQEEIDNP